MIHFDWFFTNWCNYACYYCSAEQDMVDDFSKSTSLSSYKLTLLRLKMVKTPFQVELLGGEPTLHSHIEEVVEELCNMEYCDDVEIITNLSRSIKFYSKFNLEKYAPKLKILASYHPEYYDETFIKKAKALTEMEHIEFMVNVNISGDMIEWDNMLDMIKLLDENGVMYGFNLLHSTLNWSTDYTEELYKKYKEIFLKKYNKDCNNMVPHKFTDGSEELLSETDIYEMGYNKLKGYKCKATYLSILMDGTIQNLCTKESINIDMSGLNKEVICPSLACTCDTMFKFPKRK